MKRSLRSFALLVMLGLGSAPLGGCATVVGTAVSPLTGAIDLTQQYLSPVEMGGRGAWWATPFVFLGGAIGGPFVALFNGVKHDVSIFKSWDRYWNEFGDIFEPYRMLDRN